jgi:RNA-directed DNA polymerase
MSKNRDTESQTAPRSSVGQKALQIVLPLEWGANDATSPAHESPCPSQAATPTDARKKKKRKWYSLYDKVFALKNLRQGWERVRRNRGAPGSDGQSVEQFEARAEEELLALHEQLKSKQYRPRPVKRVMIPKPGGGRRPLGIPSIRDRIVQQAVLQVLEPIFEAKFSRFSHGFRPGRGCHTALGIVDQAIRHGYEWIADADIEKFFESVDHEVLLDAVHEEISDGSMLRLIRSFLESGVLLDGGKLEPSEQGTPQGGPLSPLLSNIYLHPLDEAMRAHGFGQVRYADDFIVLTKSRERAEEALELAQEVLDGLKLRLHPGKTHAAKIDEGFDFLGYRYFRDRQGRLQKIVSRKSSDRFRERIRERTRRRAGQRRRKAKRVTADRLRANSQVQKMIAAVNEHLIGWHAYFRGVRTSWFEYLSGDFDGFVRRRIRSAIAGRYAKGRWHQILSNRLLEELGLVSAHDLQECYLTVLRSRSPTSG